MSKAHPTHRETMQAARVHRARIVLQSLRTIGREGVLYADGGLTLDRAGFLEQVAHRMQYRINRAAHTKAYTGHDRANHIARYGEGSKWYFARNSKEKPGANGRSIGAALARIERKLNKGAKTQ